ncbi:uncharacterized protein LOC135810028 [Sycon ciliatum]|uniref:uncharacterized protein LOC135810028 n=1 Tax=Sycon ciliatum TaxID=27933 RepID=UPI0031F603DC
MNFASPYVYTYSDSEEEFFEDTELYTPMDSRGYAEPAASSEIAAELPTSALPDTEEVSGVRVQLADDALPAAIPAPAEDEDDEEEQAGEASGVEGIHTVPTAAAAPAAQRAPSFMQRLANRVRTTLGGSEPPAHRSAPSASHRSADARFQYQPLHRGRMHAGRRADTNVIAIKFNQLTEPSKMHTGEVVTCTCCRAVLSHFSRLTPDETRGEDAKIWVCEFCGEENSVDISEEEVPKKEDVTFMITPAPATSASLAADQSGAVDKSIIVFCVDVSGSMSVTTEVPGRFQLRGRINSTPGRISGDSLDQRLPNERRNVTYVSRLQAMQAAVDDQLTTMKEKFPARRVALIAFNNEVRVIGTSDQVEVVITGDKLNNKETLLRMGSSAGLPGTVKDVVSSLSEKLFQLEEDGATALGPALLVSIALAGQEAGSKVIICTDGLANVGLGNLEDITPDNPEKMKQAQEFFDECGELATEKGVSVSVVTIEGNRCRTLELGSVADSTGGAIDTVDPMHLTERFGSILSNPVIATNVTAKLLLHNKLYVRQSENPEDHTQSVIEQRVGNVTKETEVTFEFGIKTDKKKKGKDKAKKAGALDTVVDRSVELSSASGDAAKTSTIAPTAAAAATEGAATSEGSSAGATAAAASAPKVPPPLMVDGKESLPFQLMINYTSREGAQSLRVLTKSKPVTKSRDVAEQNLRYDVLGANSAQRSARAVMEGEYTSARSSNLLEQRLLYRHSGQNETSRERYRCFVGNMRRLDNEVLQAQSREVATTGRTYSDASEEEDALEDMESAALAMASLGAPAAAAAPRTKSPRKSGATTAAGQDGDGSSDSDDAETPKEPAAKKPGKKKEKKRKAARKVDCEDEAANAAYKMKSASSKMFME